VQWLASIGRTDLAEAVAAGSLMGGDAAAIALQPEAPAPDREIRTDQNGVDRYVDDGSEVFPGIAATPAVVYPTDLREEWNALPGVKSFQSLAGAYGRIQAAAGAGTPSGDVALIYNFMKLLDPGSTVMQGEIATASEAPGIENSILQLYNSAVEGQVLTDEKRREILDIANGTYKAAQQGYRGLRSQYEDTALDAGLDPAATLTDYQYRPTGSMNARVQRDPAQQRAAPTTTAPATQPTTRPTTQPAAQPLPPTTPMPQLFNASPEVAAAATAQKLTVQELWAKMLLSGDAAAWLD